MKLLGSVVTNDVAALEAAPAIYAGLLTPQGKIIADFLLVRDGDGVLIDVAMEKRAELAAKLKLYRLRAKVTIDERPDLRVYADIKGGEGVPDPRLQAMGTRRISGEDVSAGDALSYDAHRIRLGVPEGGKDWDFGDAFPHEALFDQLHGVSFTKGCYVGQEIVSRMEHRGTARSRVVKVSGESRLPTTRADIKAGDVVIGKLGSVDGTHGLALLRIDRVAEFQAKGVVITADGVPLAIEVPEFARFRIG